MGNITNHSKHNHHKYPNEYQFAVQYAHYSPDQEHCHQWIATETVHSRSVLDKPEVVTLGLNWLSNLPKSIDVGDDQLVSLDKTIFFKSSYISASGKRVYEEWGMPMLG